MEEITMSFTLKDEEGTIKGEIQGITNLPFWKHDLKMRTAINLLESVNEKDFEERFEFEKYLMKLEEIISSFRD